MVRGLYTAWTGLRNEEKRMDVVTNNMANADTTGYKKVDVTSQSFDRQLAVKIDDPTIEHKAGHRRREPRREDRRDVL